MSGLGNYYLAGLATISRKIIFFLPEKAIILTSGIFYAKII